MDRMGGMVRLVKKVLICVFGAEGIGAVCYTSSIYSAVRSGKRSGILCFYGSSVAVVTDEEAILSREDALGEFQRKP